MGHAGILDCTLRDGAYLVDKYFGEKVINGIIGGLCESKIDIIEMGFLQDEGAKEGKTVYLNSKGAEKNVPKEKGNTLFAVLADYSRYSVENLDEYTGTSFDIVRICFFKHERYDAMESIKEVKKRGYKVFVQPVDIMGYADTEILELVDIVNEIEPYCFSIVDTFGSMYVDDLQRLFSILDHNLVKTCKIGFHSHNNMQMSNALSQAFLQMSFGKREVYVDTTISGMGRGAGNTPTELIMQYMISKMNYNYNLDAILDVIDTYMDSIRNKCTWGYNTPYFIAGCYGAHVNNIAYLTQKPTIRSKDIRFILNKIGETKRKRYDYDLLEETYVDYMKSDIDDEEAIRKLKELLTGKNVVVVAPGNSTTMELEKIQTWQKEKSAVVLAVNFLPEKIRTDYVFFSNVRRYRYWEQDVALAQCIQIVTSNLNVEKAEDIVEVSFTKLIKCGWENMDNAMILLLRLLDIVDANTIGVAGFDGYQNGSNYVSTELEVTDVKENFSKRNQEIQEMLDDYMKTRIGNAQITFLTTTRFHI